MFITLEGATKQLRGGGALVELVASLGWVTQVKEVLMSMGFYLVIWIK